MNPNLKIVLPETLGDFYSESGYSDTTYFEGRRNSRLRVRCEANLEFQAGPPSIQRIEREAIVLIKDISRRGISFLAHTQLWPEERVQLTFHNREVSAVIVRCRRLGEACWECGAEITDFKNNEGKA